MITKIAEYFTLSFLNTEMTEESERKIVQYGIELIFSTIWGYCLALIVGMIFGQLKYSLLFAVIFSIVRSFTGGYHADTYLKCNCTMIIVSVIHCVLMVIFVEYLNFRSLFCISVMIISIIAFKAPVQNKHKVLSKEKKNKYHKFSILLSATLCIVSGILYFYSKKLCCAILATMVIISILIYFWVQKNENEQKMESENY